MEYCGGGDLMGLLIKKDILSADETRFYMAELAIALNHIHKLGYIHCDLKPENVLIGNDGHIRLSDFGSAKVMNKNKNNIENLDADAEQWSQYAETVNKIEAKDDVKVSTGLTRSYSTVGTPDYVALELLRQKDFDHRVDWWSFGIIMFECLVGYSPFCGNGPASTCRKIIQFEKYFQIPNELIGKEVPITARDLMHQLVTHAEKRINFDKMQDHAFFKV